MFWRIPKRQNPRFQNVWRKDYLTGGSIQSKQKQKAAIIWKDKIDEKPESFLSLCVNNIPTDRNEKLSTGQGSLCHWCGAWWRKH